MSSLSNKSHIVTAKYLSKLSGKSLQETIQNSQEFFSMEIQQKLLHLLELSEIASNVILEMKKINTTKKERHQAIIYKKIYALLELSKDIELKNIIFNDFFELIEKSAQILFPTLLKLYDECFFQQKLYQFMRSTSRRIIFSWKNDDNIDQYNNDDTNQSIVLMLDKDYFRNTKQNNEDILSNFLLNFETEFFRTLQEIF